MEQQVLAWITQYGYLAIFFLLVFGIIGLPIPDETLLTFTGYLIYRGNLSLPLAFATALAGSASGITISYALGRSFGLAVLHRYGKYLHLTQDRLNRAHAWFERIGHWALTFGYFIPGVRHLTAYAAGMTEVAPHQFALFAYSGSVLWVSSFLALGYFLGERWQAVEENVDRYLVGISIALAVAIMAYLLWRKWRKR
ncbi:MAG: DedA family protein [Terriglobia bacterium]|nr:MAG: DedA family protein [Terriglobia bacterium]